MNANQTGTGHDPEKARRTLIETDVVETDPEATRLAALCRLEGTGWMNTVFPGPGLATGNSYVGFGDESRRAGISISSGGYAYTYHSPRALRDAAEASGDYDRMMDTIERLQAEREIRSADICWAFQDDTIAGYSLVGVRMRAVPAPELGWGSDNRPPQVVIEMRVPHQLAETLRGSQLTDARFARSFAQQMFPEWIAQTHQQARRDQPDQRGSVQLEPLIDPAITVNDARTS